MEEQPRIKARSRSREGKRGYDDAPIGLALISSDGSIGNGCYVYCNRGQNYIYLMKDDGT